MMQLGHPKVAQTKLGAFLPQVSLCWTTPVRFKVSSKLIPCRKEGAKCFLPTSTVYSLLNFFIYKYQLTLFYFCYLHYFVTLQFMFVSLVLSSPLLFSPPRRSSILLSPISSVFFSSLSFFLFLFLFLFSFSFFFFFLSLFLFFFFFFLLLIRNLSWWTNGT